MNIHAKKGHKVMVTEETKNSGYASDAEQIAQRLEIGKVYLVDRTEVGNSRISVWLQGFDVISFNSVNFVDAEIGAGILSHVLNDDRWQPTNHMRWHRHDTTKGYNGKSTADILQQLWQDGAGGSQWREVAVAKE